MAAFDGDQLVGAVPIFLVKFRLGIAFEPRFRNLASWLSQLAPRLMSPVVLGIGSPFTEECPIGISPVASPVERARVFVGLLEGLSDHAERLGVSMLTLKDVRDDDTLWAGDMLIKAGFSRFASLPVAQLELPFRNEAEYLATLSPRLRSELRRKMRKASEITMELRNSIDGIHREVFDLFQATRSYRRADYGSFDDVPETFFPEIMRNLNGRAKIMLCRHADQIVSFSIFLIEQNRVLAKFIGMRYPAARELNLYYYNWLMMVRFCIANGLVLMQTGQTTYDIKVRLGSRLRRSWIYFKHRALLANKLFGAIAPLASLDRTDPGLRALGTKAPYVT
jgi:predicted N-acyltransferase